MVLVEHFYGDLLDQIVNFYQGPLRLNRPEDLLMNMCGENDIALVVHQREMDFNSESPLNLKSFRKFSTLNTNKSFHLKYYYCTDPELAAQIGIKNENCLYTLRQTGTPYV